MRYAGAVLHVGGASQRNFAVESQDMLLLKVCATNGTVAWARTWNGPADRYDEIDGIIVEDGYVYVSGWADITTDYTAGDIALVKFTEDGAFVADTLWGGAGREEANEAMASDGTNLYVTGVVDGINLFSGGDAVVVAFDQASLTEVWNRTWGGAQVDDGYGLTLQNGSLYVTGLTTSFGGDRIFLLKYDVEGNRISDGTWGAAGAESARSVGVTGNGSFVYIAGKTNSYGNGSFDVLLLRDDQTGGLGWFRTWGGTGSDASHGLAVASDALYVVGETGSLGRGGTDVLLLRIGLDGQPSLPGGPPAASGGAVVIVVAAVVVAGIIIGVFLIRRRRHPPA